MRDDRQRGRDDAEPQPPAQSLVDLLDAAAHVLGLGEHAMGMLERELALRREADEAMAALDDRRAELLFELADRRRQRRLGHMARRRRSAEMLFARERDEIFELAKDHGAFPCSRGADPGCRGLPRQARDEGLRLQRSGSPIAATALL